MAVQNPSARDTKKTPVYMENMSFDPVYEVLASIPLTLNPVTNALERQTGIQGNASYSLSYTGGNLTTLQKTVGSTTYQKTFTWTDGVLTAISTWTQV